MECGLTGDHSTPAQSHVEEEQREETDHVTTQLHLMVVLTVTGQDGKAWTVINIDAVSNNQMLTPYKVSVAHSYSHSIK